MSKKGLGKLVLGAGIGASLALLFAPKKGSDLRNDIKKKINEFMKSVDDMTVSEIKDESSKIKELFYYLDSVTFKKEEKERFISEVKSESIKHRKNL